MKLSQNQRPKITLLRSAVAVGILGLVIFLLSTLTNIFSPKDSLAIPSNAAEFNETCYSIADGGSGLYEFNKNTGGPTSQGNTNIGSPEASTLNLFGDTLFTIDGSAGEFGYVNVSNGSYTILNSNYEATELDGVDGKIVFDDIDAMTVDNNDVFWVASRDNNDTDPSYLAKMNHKGEFIENAFGIGVDYVKYSGPDGFPSVIDAMGYDPIGEVLFVCANDGSGNPTYNNMMQVNPITGAGTLIGNFSIGDVEGMGFDGEGNMYVTTGTSSSTTANRNSFFSVDKTTAKATRVFTFSGQTDFETCDCVIGYKNTIKGTVFYDVDENGFIGNGESGYEGVTVNLYYDENNNGVYDAGTDGFIRSAVTNELGQYTLYDAYEDGTLNYVLTINTNDLPNDNSLTTDNAEIASFSSGGNTDINNDFGYKLNSVSNNTISGFVYMDDNENQDFGNSEEGVENVTVYLYQDINGNGVYDEGTDIIATSQQTESDGSYSFVRPYIGGTAQIAITPSSNSGDGEEYADGSITLTSSDLDFGDKNVGISFVNANIPQGATIESAYFEVESNGRYTSTTNISITGEDTDNGTSFTTSNGNITSRTQTSASVDWIMPYWTATDIRYQSPDIASIIQEIVDRNGWDSGNNINLLTDLTSGIRGAKSYDESASDAPKLYVTYSDPSVTDNYLTFVDVSTLPTSATLTTDNIETASFTSGGNTDPDNNFGIYQDPASFNTISGTVFYDDNGDGTNNGSDIGENNITVCLFNDENGNSAYDPGTDVLLQIQKTDVNGNYSFEEEYGNNELTDNIRISQSSDDADDGSVTITSTDMDIAESDVALRFQNINIPQGATITTAYINFNAEENATGSYSTNIEGIDVNNASTFNAGQNLNNLTRTTANVTWSASDSWTIGQEKSTPSLVTIAQEIVDRSGWSSGNSMGFILNEGTGKRAAESFNGDASEAPELVIGYEVATVNYVVIIKQDNLPNGYELTTDNLETASFSSGGNSDPGNDFGYELNTTGLNVITGTVFNDGNQDGVKASGESVVSGIAIKLYEDKNCNGSIDNGEVSIGSTITNINGTYQFNQSFGATIESRVSQSSDDADESTLSTSSSDLDFAQSQVAVRFNGLTIPQGADITSAYIEFTAEATKTGSYSFNVEGVDVNNASTFSNSQNLNSLAKTSASALMSGSDTWTADNIYNSPSITSIVQEIVDRSGWSSGNSMAFVFGTGSGDRDAYSYDQSPGNAPRLVVNYEPSSLCYITEIQGTSISIGGNLTTPSTQTASFNSSGNTDPNNDFGVYYAPLPVELIAFNASWVGRQVQLNWTTATEINNDYFDVQWSTDGVLFESIGTVVGYGNSIKEIDYSFVHQQPASVNYYRLKQHDYDGAFEYSSTIILNGEGGNETTIDAFPNPFNSSLSINITSNESTEANVEIRSIDGRSVYSKSVNLIEGNQSVVIDEAANFEFGAYIVVLNTGKEVKTLRVVKR